MTARMHFNAGSVASCSEPSTNRTRWPYLVTCERCKTTTAYREAAQGEPEQDDWLESLGNGSRDWSPR